MQAMKLRESIRLESSEFRRAVARARKVYGDWLNKCMRVAATPRHADDEEADSDRDHDPLPGHSSS